ncbi:hypothetical protein BDZ91DRAFT_752531 [Kalaharituber pfeilii]|nr:hypothetical protein BDZ91DRAFT_752531 [Kalaharituber pfeilii]
MTKLHIKLLRCSKSLFCIFFSDFLLSWVICVPDQSIPLPYPWRSHTHSLTHSLTALIFMDQLTERYIYNSDQVNKYSNHEQELKNLRLPKKPTKRIE